MGTELNLDVSLSLIGGYRETGTPNPTAQRIAFLDRLPFVQGDGTSAYDVSQIYIDEQGTFTTSRSIVLVNGSDLDPLSIAIDLALVKYIYFKNTHASNSIVVAGSFWKSINAAGMTMTIAPGESFVFGSPTVAGFVVEAAVADTITLTAATGTYKLIILGVLSVL